MTAAVLSVEKFSVTKPDASVTVTLTLGQDIDNCIPFFTWNRTVEGNDDAMIDIVKNGTDKFDFVAIGADGTGSLEITIVEFDPVEVKVQSGTLSNVTTSSTVTIGTAVVIANTIPFFYGKTTDTTDDYEQILVHVEITGTTTITITRQDATGTFSGHWYVAEAINGGWTVDIQKAAYTTAQTTINKTISVTPANTGLWLHWDTSETSDDPRDAIWSSKITDSTNWDATRGNGGTPSASGDVIAHIVKFDSTVATVQQKELDYLTATTKTVAITAPGTLGNTMVVATDLHGFCEGNAAINAKAGANGILSFNSSTEVLGTRAVSGGGNYKQQIQIIEWLIGGAAVGLPPRSLTALQAVPRMGHY